MPQRVWVAAELMIVSGGWNSIPATTAAHYTSTDKLAMNIRGNSAASTGSPTAVVGNPVTDDVFREGPQVSQRRYPIISYPYGDFIPASLWECRTQVRFRLAKQHLPELLVACPGSSQKFTSTRTNQRTCSPGSRLGQQQQHQRQYRRHHPPPQS